MQRFFNILLLLTVTEENNTTLNDKAVCDFILDHLSSDIDICDFLQDIDCNEGAPPKVIGASLLKYEPTPTPIPPAPKLATDPMDTRNPMDNHTNYSLPTHLREEIIKQIMEYEETYHTVGFEKFWEQIPSHILLSVLLSHTNP